MFPDLDAVTASYCRCFSGEGFIDTFYELFLAKSQEVADKFRGTDFKRQKRVLRESLLTMLRFSRGFEFAREDLERLGMRHGRCDLDISPQLYCLWLDALCEAVERHDPECTADLSKKWMQAMSPGIELIVARY
jgi:hemoglobin-like flavoprotein